MDKPREKPNPAHFAYTLITNGLFIYGLPLFWAFSRLTARPVPGFSQRLGIYPASALDKSSGSPKIWIHASSVGEAGVADAIAKAFLALYPKAGFVVSFVTSQGLAHARRLFCDNAACVYAPLDFKASVQKALHAVQPDVMVFLETELWPQWFAQAKKEKIPIIVANGRISPRSVGSYLRFRPLFSYTLKKVSAFSMISHDDAVRIQKIGAPKNRIFVNGNAKYDQLASQATPELREKAKKILGCCADAPIIVAGSTRKGEEEAVLDMFKKVREKFDKAVLVLAPRHVKRANALAEIVKSRNFGVKKLSSLSNMQNGSAPPVLIVDTMGLLFALYSQADVVFCGGSLVDLGGQNVMEAAVWGKPVLYGPYMDDFAHARTLLEKSGGGMTIKNSDDLAQNILNLLQDPKKVKAMGEKARQCVMAHKGAAQRHARVIADALIISCQVSPCRP